MALKSYNTRDCEDAISRGNDDVSSFSLEFYEDSEYLYEPEARFWSNAISSAELDGISGVCKQFFIPQLSRSPSNFPSIITNLLSLIPQRPGQAPTATLDNLLCLPYDEAYLAILRYAVYLLTNDHLDFESSECSYQFFLENISLSSLVGALNPNLATLEAFSQGLLKAALRIRNKEAVELLLVSGFEFREIMHIFDPEIAIIVKKNDISLVRLLIEHGLDVNMEIFVRNTVVPLLRLAPSVELFQVLIQAGAAIDAWSWNLSTDTDHHPGRYPVHNLEDYPTRLYKYYFPPRRYMTLLAETSLHGNIDFANILLKTGATINFAPGNEKDLWLRSTPLMAAMEGGNNEIIRALLESSADIEQHCAPLDWGEIETDYFWDGVDICATEEKCHYEDFVIHDCPVSPLQMAARSNNVEATQVLLAYGSQVDSLNQWWRHAGKVPERYSSEGGPGPTGVSDLLFSGEELTENEFEQPHGLCKSPLLEAVENSNTEIVEILLKNGANVNKRVIGRFGTYILDAAEGNRKIYDLLIKSGANLARQRTRLDLQLAVRRKDSKAVEDLLRKGFDVNSPALNHKHGNLIHMAIMLKDYDTLKLLLRYGASINSEDIPVTALQLSVKLHDFQAVRISCDTNADPNGVGASLKLTPLQLAFSYTRGLTRAELISCVSIFQLLLDQGADVNVASSENTSTPLQCVIRACPREHVYQLVKDLLEAGADINAKGRMSALQEAIFRNDLLRADGSKLLLLLLNAKADVNYGHGYYFTPIQLVASYVYLSSRQRIDITQLLLSYGAKVNSPASTGLLFYYPLESGLVTRGHGGTALQRAIFSGHIELTKLLLINGAEVNASFLNDGRSTLQQASFRGNLELVKLCLKYGAEVNTPPCERGGLTALQAAVMSNRPHSMEIVQLLLDKKANINAPASHHYGMTALQAAACTGNIEIARKLIGAGGDVNSPGSIEDGITALEAAVEHGRLDMVQLLLNEGADLNLPKERRYRSAADRAKRRCHIAIYNLLMRYANGQA